MRAFLRGWGGLILLGAMLALAGGWALREHAASARHEDKLSSERSLEPLFKAQFTDLAGRSASLAAWRGRALVVNFWASWCGPCRDEIPDLVAVSRKFPANRVQFIGVAVDKQENAAQFARELGIDYPILVGGFQAAELARAAGDKYAVLPYTLVIGKDGGLVNARLGRIAPAELEASVQAALR